MMKKLSDDLKRMLSGLAFQHESDYLPMRDKMKALGMESGTRAKHPSPPHTRAIKPSAHRIALISDGRGAGAPLDYAIDACSRQKAKIDLLIHGPIDTASLSVLENRIQAAGVEYHRIQLGMKPVDAIAEYICNHPSLIFLVAMPEDAVAKVLIEKVIPRCGGRIPVPLVLIEDRPATGIAKQSAA